MNNDDSNSPTKNKFPAFNSAEYSFPNPDSLRLEGESPKNHPVIKILTKISKEKIDSMSGDDLKSINLPTIKNGDERSNSSSKSKKLSRQKTHSMDSFQKPMRKFSRFLKVLLGYYKRHYKRIVVNYGANADQEEKYNFASNEVKTTKYNILTWIPKSLLLQFMRAANVYFLLITILTSMAFSPKKPESQILTFVTVLGFTMIKEAVEDYSRYKQDNLVNNKLCRVYSYENKEIMTKYWQDILVGDILMLEKDEEIPADILLLKSSSSNGYCYVDTMNLDGEVFSPLNKTNLKDKVSCSSLQKMSQEQIFSSTGKIKCDGPTESLDFWEGHMILSENAAKPEPLDIKNLVLRGSTLRNTAWILGLVVFCGHQTKIFINSRKKPMKFSKVMKMMNKILYTIFLFQAVLCVSLAAASLIWQNQNHKEYFYLEIGQGADFLDYIERIFVYLVAYSQLIPISLYVALEVLKLILSYFVSVDKDMYYEPYGKYVKVKTSDLIEELGQIEFLFSDKTGTLTCNEMIFRKCYINGKVYGGKSHLKAKEKSIELENKNSNSVYQLDGDGQIYNDIKEGTRNSEKIIDFFKLVALCHDVVPDLSASDEIEMKYQAQSPDELALVEGASEVGFKFFNKEKNTITLKLFDRAFEEYEVIEEFPFDSTRKRMSVIIKIANSQKYLLLCKGADSTMIPNIKASPEIMESLKASLNGFAVEGLRTLVMGKRWLTENDLKKISDNLELAKQATGLGKEAQMCEIYNSVESELKLVGASAIEDKLQNHVPETISELMRGGIRVWVLTGDKQETAIEIGKSCKLIQDKMDLAILSSSDKEEFLSKLEHYTQKYNVEAIHNVPIKGKSIPKRKVQGRNLAMVIDGFTLSFALDKSNPLIGEKLFRLGLEANSCICCRVSPKQKADIVALAKKYGKYITASIGDGANDVSMILEAHIGIGIFGKEGTQAARSADFAISQFHFLRKLLLVHGRWNYKRISSFIYYYFYKNCTMVFTEVSFSFVNGFSGQIYFIDWLPLLFNAFWTSWPCMANFALEKDLDPENSLKFAKLYKIGQKNLLFNVRTFWKWIIFSIVHGLACFWIPILGNLGTYSSDGLVFDHWTISTSSFCILIHTITLKLFLETYFWTWLNLILGVISVIVFYLTILVMSTVTFARNFQPEINGIIDKMFCNSKLPLMIMFSPFAIISIDIMYLSYTKIVKNSPFDQVLQRFKSGKTRVKRN